MSVHPEREAICTQKAEQCSSAVTAPEKDLNELYLDVLKHSISLDYSQEEKEEARDILTQILRSVVVW
jgi:hypothetical protein